LPLKRRAGRLLLCLLVVLFNGILLSACLPAKSSPEQARGFQAEGENLFDQSQIPAALVAMRKAADADPTDVQIASRLGELHEFVDEPEMALNIYRKVLGRTGLPSALHEELTYRSALICMLKLNQREAAATLYALLPPGPRRTDLQAVMLLADGNPRSALTLLNTVREQPLEQTVAARVALHAARAYIALGSADEALALLYQAINLAGRSAVTRDIELVWSDLKLQRERP
jgi:tetratricopeptide (TPR) repeat protein